MTDAERKTVEAVRAKRLNTRAVQAYYLDEIDAMLAFMAAETARADAAEAALRDAFLDHEIDLEAVRRAARQEAAEKCRELCLEADGYSSLNAARHIRQHFALFAPKPEEPTR